VTNSCAVYVITSPRVAEIRMWNRVILTICPRNTHSQVDQLLGNTMKGDRKRKLHGFKSNPGNRKDSPWKAVKCAEDEPVGSKRLKLDDFTSIVNESKEGILVIRDNLGSPVNQRILRPQPAEKDVYAEYNNNAEGIRPDAQLMYMVHLQKTEYLWNSSVREHAAFRENCPGNLLFDTETAEKRGICWRMGLKCEQCGYTSKIHKLFDEKQDNKRGRKAALPNIGLQIGLNRQGIGASGFCDIVNSANMVAPARSGMQKAANKVCDQMVQQNEADMLQRIEHLKDLNETRALPRNHPITVESDGTYNNKMFSGVGKTPFQAGTQATYLTCENTTPQKKIIAVGTYNKLCRCGLSIEGVQHTPHCSANIPYTASIGDEGKYVVDAITKINNAGMSVSAVTLDGDTKATSAVHSLNQPDFDGKPLALRCTRHLGRGLEKKLKGTTFSDKMFAKMGRNKTQKRSAQNRFAMDLGKRCEAEFQAAFEKHRGNVNILAGELLLVTEAIVDCYKGNCDECIDHSFVCKGKQNPWPRPYLPKGRYIDRSQIIDPDDEDLMTLLNIILIRLGHISIEAQQLNTNQNKCEAANRGLSKAVPKHLTFSRNFYGRVAGAVFSMNNQPGAALLKMSKNLGAPIIPGSKVVVQLQQKDKEYKKDQERKSSLQYTMARSRHRNIRFSLYDQLHRNEENDNDAGRYRQGVEDNDFWNQFQEFAQRLRIINTDLDHCYSTASHQTDHGADHSYAREHQTEPIPGPSSRPDF